MASIGTALRERRTSIADIGGKKRDTMTLDRAMRSLTRGLFRAAPPKVITTSFGRRPTWPVAAGGPLAAVLLLIAAPIAPATATVPRHVLFQGGSERFGDAGYVGLYRAAPTGGDAQLANGSSSSRDSLSPDGRFVAYAALRELDVADVTGGSPITIYEAAHGIWNPRFAPNGREIIFAEQTEYGSTERIRVINTDGTGLHTVVSSVSQFAEAPTFSPDGRKIAYSTGSEAEGRELIVANADGSEPKAVATGLEHASEPRFSPDGTKLAFQGWSKATPGEEEGEGQIFVSSLDGTGLTQLSFDELAVKPEWTFDGANVVYTAYKEGANEQLYYRKADGTGGEALFEPLEAGFFYTREFAVSPAGGPSDDEYLGATFEPTMRFDSEEKWRPLDVGSFMAEQDPSDPGHSYNKLCHEEECGDLPENWQAAIRGSSEASGRRYLKMGKLAGEEYPTSPESECHTEGLWECNDGPRTAMYFHVLPSATANEATEPGYNYVDYWMFYRYNQDQNDPGSIDDHQGDWEGLSVAPTPGSDETFDFVIFAQHANHYTYAPEDVECAGTSCGTFKAPGGQRVIDYIAAGTHASYPNVDTGGGTGICTQTESGLPDGCHDGEAWWGGGGPKEFPPNGEGNWVDWPGSWGADQGGLLGTGESPASPGRQSRYECPWKWSSSWDPTACPAAAQQNSMRAHDAEAASCASWFGPSVVAAVCTPHRLQRAVNMRAMNRAGAVRIRLEGHAGRAGSRPGVAQAVGAPLRVGQWTRVTGHADPGTELLVRAQGDGHLVEARFTDLGLRNGGSGSVRVVRARHGIRLVWVRPDGRVAVAREVRSIAISEPIEWKTARREQRFGAGQASRVSARRLQACTAATVRYRRRLKTIRRLANHRTPLERRLVRRLHHHLAYSSC